MWKHPSQESGKSVKQRCSRCHASGRILCEFCGGKGDIVVGRDTNGNRVALQRTDSVIPAALVVRVKTASE